MRWIGISGSRVTNDEVERDVRVCVRDLMTRGDGIVSGGAVGVDYFATDEALACNPSADRIKIYLPATLERYALHYRERAAAGVITSEQAENLIEQLATIKARNPLSIIEDPLSEAITLQKYFDRDTLIVLASDELAAFHVNGSVGTKDTIDKARAQGKPVALREYTI